jgi:hypothetical protein
MIGPAHMTLLYPFKPPDPPDEITRIDFKHLNRCFGTFNYKLTASMTESGALARISQSW